MAENQDRITDIRPKLRRCSNGGWLATCPRNSGISFGVAARTEREAVEKFRFTFMRWLEILERKT